MSGITNIRSPLTIGSYTSKTLNKNKQKRVLTLTKRLLCDTIYKQKSNFIFYSRGYGGIGRRARFRIWYLRCAGSSPVTRTTGSAGSQVSGVCAAVFCLSHDGEVSLWTLVPTYQLLDALLCAKAGDTVALTVLRTLQDGSVEEIDVSVTLTDRHIHEVASY